jgi:putative transposase
VGYTISNTLQTDMVTRVIKNAVENYGAPEIINSDYAEENTMSKFFQIVLYKGFFAETSA